MFQSVLLEHFYPLIDRGLREQYPDLIPKYGRGVTLLLDGRPVLEPALESKLAYFKEIKILVQHQTKAFGWLGVYTGNDAPPIPPGIML